MRSESNDEAVLRMLAGGVGAAVVLPSGRRLDGDEAQALTSYYAPDYSAETALFGEEVVVELERIEGSLGHDMWAEEEGRERVQRWDCQRCSAVLVRRFADGGVTGSARDGVCPGRGLPRRRHGFGPGDVLRELPDEQWDSLGACLSSVLTVPHRSV